MDKLKTQYRGVRKLLRTYWKLYGGISALVSSPYIHLSFLLSLILYPVWLEARWSPLSLEILPSTLGFSLGAYAILISFSDQDFLKKISLKKLDSPFINTSALFVHLIIVQFLALLAALISEANPLGSLSPAIRFFINLHLPFASKIRESLYLVGNFTGFILLMYSMFSFVAATLAVFRLSTWYNTHIVKLAQRDDSQRES